MTAPDRRPALYQAYRLAAEATGRVTQAQLRLSTPCRDYDVSALVDHLVGAADRAAALGRGETPTSAEFRHVELAEAPSRLRQAAKEAEAAWADDARLSATVTMPWGETYNGTTLVDMYLAELAAHTWDLAVATGQSLPEGDLAATALDAAQAMLRPEYRNMMGEGSPYGSEIEPPADATPWERLAAFTGRPPRPAA